MKHFVKNVVVVTCLVAIGAVGTWIVLRPRLPRGDGFTDGEQLLAATRTRDELRLARWETPQRLAALTDGSSASEPFVEPATGRLFFAKGAIGSEDLWLATPEGAGFVVRPIAELNSPRRETAPTFHDGWLWFASDRAGGLGGLDLWRAPLAGDRFLAPENVGAPINSAADETDPALRGPSGELWFASNRQLGGSGDWNLFVSKSDGVHFAPPLFADKVDSPFDERAPAFTPDGRVLLFSSDRMGGAGGFDLWRSLLRDGEPEPPHNLGTPNGPGDESGPTLTDDGFTLLYAAATADATTPDTADSAAPPHFELLKTRTRELFAVEAPLFTLADFTILLLLALVALLAWLARHWEALDILWKCMVVSLLLHLLFLWYSRLVDVESHESGLGAPQNTFEVELLGEVLADVARLEDRAHGDSVEVAATASTMSALTRESVLPEIEEAAPSDDSTAIARSAAESVAAAPTAHERSITRAVSTAQNADPLHDPSESFERLSGSAAPVTVAAQVLGDPASASAAPTRFTPNESEVDAAALAPRDTTPATRERAASTSAAPPTARARDLTPVTRDRPESASRPVATAMPAERAEPIADSSNGSGSDGASGTPAAIALAPVAMNAAAVNGTAANAPEATSTGLGTTTPLHGAFPSSPALPESTPTREPALASRAGNDAAAVADTTSDSLPSTIRAKPARRDLQVDAHHGGPVALAPIRDSTDGAADEGNAANATGRPSTAPAPTLALGPRSTSDRDTRGTAASVASTPASALAKPDGIGDIEHDASLSWSTPGDGTSPVTARADSMTVDAPARRATRAEPTTPSRSALPTVALATPRESSAPTARGASPAVAAAATSPAVLALGPSIGVSDAALHSVVPALAAGPLRATFVAATPAPDLTPAPSTTPLEIPAAPVARASDVAPPPPTAARLYQRRFGEAKAVAVREGGGSEATERAVQGGLRYLASIQRSKGSWGDANEINHDSKYRDVRVGKTALAVLAFLGAGHTHQSASEFSPNVARALTWLLARQDPETGHFGDSESYSHGIATYALAECYAITKDAALRPTIERALTHLLSMQQRDTDDPRKEGGWTYYYPEGPGVDDFPRASISAWQVMALESAKVGGIEVPDDALAAARGYFLNSFDPSFGGFRYTHNPSWGGGGYGTLPASTPASMFALVLLGEKDHPRVAAAEQFVLERLPNGYRWRGQDAFVRQGQAHVYYWYYSTLALFCRGGAAWRTWNDALQRTLLPAQQRDGGWEAIDLYATDYALDDRNDRSYTTSMCVLMLEVYYRYFTPLLGKLEEE